jgi:hypothetical protein
MEYDNLIGAQIDALEQWIDFRQSGGTKGALPPDSLGGFPREWSRRPISALIGGIALSGFGSSKRHEFSSHHRHSKLASLLTR